MKIISITDLLKIIRRGPALVIGPKLTQTLNRENECLVAMASTFPLELKTPSQDFLEYADQVISSGQFSEHDVITLIRNHFSSSIHRSPDIYRIVPANWTSIISLTIDDHFRSEFREFKKSKPASWSVSTISEPSVLPPIRSIPYFALMGDPQDNRELSRTVFSRSEYIKRKILWEKMLRTLPDIVKSEPLIFVGTEVVPGRVADLLTELLRLAPKTPKRLVFLGDDPTPSNPIVANLMANSFDVLRVDCGINDIGNHLTQDNIAAYSLPLFSSVEGSMVSAETLLKIEGFVSYVPRREEIDVNLNARNRLRDLLFRPNHLDWSPYAADLEFKRDITEELIAEVGRHFIDNNLKSIPVNLSGEAGVGKTVVLRSLAFALAQKGYCCLWLKKNYSDSGFGRFSQVIQTLNDEFKGRTQKVIFFLDDPVGSRISPTEVITALSEAHFDYRVVICRRKTDEVIVSQAGETIEVSPNFTDAELERFPEYLVGLGAAETLEKAKASMVSAGMRSGRDILCNLWYSLPQTKAALEESIGDEYERIKGAVDFIDLIYRADPSSARTATQAYELVVAASALNDIPVPVEILVNALGISFSEWHEQCAEGKPVWGLLYEEDLPGTEMYSFRPRNHVVSEIVLRKIRGDSPGRSSEVRLLKRMLSGCFFAKEPYKTFLEDVLVHRRKLIETRFVHDQAMELYDAALDAYPRPFPVLRHHRAICSRHLGGSAREAYQEISELIPQSYDRSIPDQDLPENLHTSAAAAMLGAIRGNEIPIQDGAEDLFKHTTEALKLDSLSLHTSHTHASSLLSLADSLSYNDPRAAAINVARAAEITERVLLLFDEDDLASPREIEGFRLFNALRNNYLETYSDEENVSHEFFEKFERSGDVTFLIAGSRILLARARSRDKGSAFKKVEAFLSDSFNSLLKRGMTVPVEIRLCRLELRACWNLARSTGPVFWEQLEEDCLFVLQKALYSGDPLWSFYLAVALFNQGKFEEAEHIFRRIRSLEMRGNVRRRTRSFYMGPSSDRVPLEGKLYLGADRGKSYVYCTSLGYDVMAKQGRLTRNPDEIKHFYIGFSFNGPMAFDILDAS